MNDPTAVAAVQEAVNLLLNTESDTTVSDALIRIIQVAAHDLDDFASELTPW